MPESKTLQVTGLSTETKIEIKGQASREGLSASDYLVQCHKEHMQKG